MLGASLLTTLVATAVPWLRSPLIGVSAWASVVLVLAGVGWHRPRARRAWVAVAVMLALWAVGTTLVQVQGHSSNAVAWTTGAGQLVAVAVTLSLVRSGPVTGGGVGCGVGAGPGGGPPRWTGG